LKPDSQMTAASHIAADRFQQADIKERKIFKKPLKTIPKICHRN